MSSPSLMVMQGPDAVASLFRDGLEPQMWQDVLMFNYVSDAQDG